MRPEAIRILLEGRRARRLERGLRTTVLDAVYAGSTAPGPPELPAVSSARSWWRTCPAGNAAPSGATVRSAGRWSGGAVSSTERVTLLDRFRPSPARTASAAALPVGCRSPPCCSFPTRCCWSSRSGGSGVATIVHELTLDNYGRLFGTDLYPDTILFSAGIALQVTAAFPTAGVSARLSPRLQAPPPPKSGLYSLVIVPLWVSYLVRAYAWKIILGQEGILTASCSRLGSSTPR